MSKNRLFLLDAYALIFRGYYAFIKNPRINSKGMDTSSSVVIDQGSSTNGVGSCASSRCHA